MVVVETLSDVFHYCYDFGTNPKIVACFERALEDIVSEARGTIAWWTCAARTAAPGGHHAPTFKGALLT
jgi:hypothetical protein